MLYITTSRTTTVPTILMTFKIFIIVVLILAMINDEKTLSVEGDSTEAEGILT